jgi:hypothetical protein
MRGAIIIVVAPPFIEPVPGVRLGKEQQVLKHSARKRPLNASIMALLVGLPVHEKSISTPFMEARRSRATGEREPVADPETRGWAAPLDSRNERKCFLGVDIDHRQDLERAPVEVLIRHDAEGRASATQPIPWPRPHSARRPAGVRPGSDGMS